MKPLSILTKTGQLTPLSGLGQVLQPLIVKTKVSLFQNLDIIIGLQDLLRALVV